MRRISKTDANQSDIVQKLRDAGVDVTVTSHVGAGFPDLVCGRAGYTYLLEIKTEEGELTPAQVDFQRWWRGHVAIVRTVDEALAAVGLL